ncbi:4Fe-4S binding protein [Lacrimispora sp. NSJ-141]|uniref:4Fe-4S binding protein n=1 Tax=Lientehia hominis TaxID=2897778 RepID=A0AAP2RIR4_9FIRM|nr:4Fe-4S binding protein [Lientehia hominis]MCD2492169.1 4Fe-4S binding protein [Lientehia hominis]
MVNKRELKLQPGWCKSCGICVAFCPKHVLELGENGVVIAHREECILCGQCEKRCPDYAVYIEEEEADNLWVKLY